MVELLISVTILAVASLALYRAFSLSAFTNKNSQKIQNATSLAESTMEEVKRLKLDKLEEIYGSGTGSFSESLDYTDTSLCSGLLSACTSGDTGLIKIVGRDVTEADKYPYYILYQDEVTATQGQKYHVVATIQSKPYAEGAPNSADSINAKALPKIEEINRAEHAVLSAEINQYDASAIKDIESQYGAGNAALDGVSTGIQKTITINIRDGAATDYAVDAGTITGDVINIDCQVDYTYASKKVTYSAYMGTFGSDKICNIYLFYNYSGMGRDDIRIIDSSSVVSGVSHNICFIEQDDPNPPEGEDGVIVTKGVDFDIYLKNRSADNSSHVFKNSDSVSAEGRTNTLYTNLYDNGSNDSATADPDKKGHLYKEEVNKNNIYEIEVVVIDMNGKVCARLKSTKAGDIEP